MNTFGNTCPCLNIAKHYNVDYSIPLYITDYYLRNVKPPEGFADGCGLSVNGMFNLQDDCKMVAEDMLDAWDQGVPGRERAEP